MKLRTIASTHLSHVLFKALNAMEEVDFMEEENEIRLRMKKTLVECLRPVRRHRGEDPGLARHLLPQDRRGQPEWDVMWSKAYDEEIRKLRVV